MLPRRARARPGDGGQPRQPGPAPPRARPPGRVAFWRSSTCAPPFSRNRCVVLPGQIDLV